MQQYNPFFKQFLGRGVYLQLLTTPSFLSDKWSFHEKKKSFSRESDIIHPSRMSILCQPDIWRKIWVWPLFELPRSRNLQKSITYSWFLKKKLGFFFLKKFLFHLKEIHVIRNHVKENHIIQGTDVPAPTSSSISSCLATQ